MTHGGFGPQGQPPAFDKAPDPQPGNQTPVFDEPSAPPQSSNGQQLFAAPQTPSYSAPQPYPVIGQTPQVSEIAQPPEYGHPAPAISVAPSHTPTSPPQAQQHYAQEAFKQQGYPRPSPSYPQYPMTAPAGPGSAAGAGVRLGAYAMDWFLLAAVSMLISIVVGIGKFAMDGSGGSEGAVSALAPILLSAISIAYTAIMEATSGQTLGKMIVGIRVVSAHGGKISFGAAVTRNFYYLSPLLLLVALIPGLPSGLVVAFYFLPKLVELLLAAFIGVTISSSNTYQGFHDKIAGGTRVVRK